MATPREIEAVLATWREVERSLSLAMPGTPEYERLTDDAGDLYAEYQRLVRDAIGAGIPVGIWKVGSENALGPRRPPPDWPA